MKTIAVLLTVHNRKEKTMKCLENLFNQQIPSGYSIAVYLTDDGCTDGTAEAVEKRYPTVQIVQGDGTLYWNRGMWTAWNAAAKHNHDYYLWLNDDTYLLPGAIEELVQSATRCHGKAIVVGACRDEKASCTTYGGRTASSKVPDPIGELQRVRTFNGNIVLIPAFVYNKVGNLDYTFRHSMGDLDYGYRASKQGIGIFQSANYLGVCDRHGTYPNWCNPKVDIKKRWKVLFSPTGYNPKERFYFEHKHYGFITATFHTALIYLRCIFPKFWILIKHDKI